MYRLKAERESAASNKRANMDRGVDVKLSLLMKSNVTLLWFTLKTRVSVNCDNN